LSEGIDDADDKTDKDGGPDQRQGNAEQLCEKTRPIEGNKNK